MLSILSKLGPEFLVFISTFHSRRLTNPNWIIPSLDSFMESPIQECDNLIHMGALKSSKNQALLVGETKNVQEKGKRKGKDKRNIEF